ncbi:MAG: MFS transporter [Rhodospirillales bacterium]|nr:MFS transporter [Rhodospirillales bacterium]
MISAASAGNALEFYDFFIYGFFALNLGKIFFPVQSQTSQLLLTFGTFGVSFFARPVGAAILGAYADSRGRSACMILSISIMTIAILMLAVLPGYEHIGLLAPLGVLLARLMQGFALGGEFGSSTALMIEHSAGMETEAAAWQGVSQNLSGLLAAGIAWMLTGEGAALGFQPFRIAFAVGAMGGIAALLLRRRIEDAPLFFEQKEAPRQRPSVVLSNIVIAAGMVAIGTAQTYLVLYLPTYGKTELGVQVKETLAIVCLLYVVLLFLTPLRLAIARRFDKSHSHSYMLYSCLAMAAMAYPAFYALQVWPTSLALFLLSLMFAFLGLPYNAPLNGFMGLVFLVKERGIGLSMGYALGIAIFGGAAPFIFTYLISATGDPRSPAMYLIITSIITLMALSVAKWRLQQNKIQGR